MKKHKMRRLLALALSALLMLGSCSIAEMVSDTVEESPPAVQKSAASDTVSSAPEPEAAVSPLAEGSNEEKPKASDAAPAKAEEKSEASDASPAKDGAEPEASDAAPAKDPERTTPDSGADDAVGTSKPAGDVPNGATDAGTPDGATDAGTPDGATDAGAPDGTTDAGAPDGATDAGTPDGATNAGAPDGTTDAGTPDGATDAGTPDGTTDAGTPDGATDAGTPDGTTGADVPDGATDAGTPDGATDADAPDGATDTNAPDGAINADESGVDAVANIEIGEIRLPEKIEFYTREEYQLVPQLLPEGAQGKLSYRTDNQGVATVDENGLLCAGLPGTCVLFVTAENGVSASCMVRTVENPVGEIPVEEIVLPEEVRIVEGRSCMIHVTLLPEGAQEELTYSIADPELAKISEDGWLDTIRPGVTELIVTSHMGKTARTPLIVEQEGAEFYEISGGVLTKYKGSAHYINLPEGVTVIGKSAFASRRDLWEITLPASLQRIEYGAFSQCESLRNVVMAGGVTGIGDYCFKECYALSSIRLSSSLTEIGKSAFEDCTSLSAIDLPPSLRSIGERAFYRCSALKKTHLPDVTYIGDGAFASTAITELAVPGSLGRITTAFLPNKLELLTLREGITAIDKWNFVYDQPLRRIELPASLTQLAKGFMTTKHCEATVYGPGEGYLPEYFANTGIHYVPVDDVTLTDEFRIEGDALVEYTGKGGRVVIPEQVTRIGSNAFEGRSDVTGVVFHDGVTMIGYEAFMNCTGLTELRLPSRLKTIGTNAFRGCTGLTHVEIPGSVTRIDGGFEECTALESVVVNEGVEVCCGFRGCVKLKRVKLPSTLKTIGGWCFFGCASLTQIDIPASVTNIGHEAFRNCTGITQIQLPAGLTNLGDCAFKGCAKLQSIRLPGKIRYVSYELFRGCSSLTGVTLPEGLYGINGGAFNGCTSLTELYVPVSVKEIIGTETISGEVFENCPKLTVYGMKGSVIQKYCVDKGVPFRILDASSASISFPEGNLVLGVGQTYTPEMLADSMAGLGSVSFTSSSSCVAVNKTTGALTAKKTGTATITAKAKNGAKAGYKVTVKAAPKSISFKEKNIKVALDEELRLQYTLPKGTAAGVTFKEESFFALRETLEPGVYIAHNTGVSTVRVTTHNGKSDTCTVTVVPKPTAVRVDRESIVLRQTRGDVIVPGVNPESVCHAYTFVSSDPGIVTVDGEGRLLGVSQGTAEITVSVPSVPGLQTTCRVTVIAPPPRISLAAEKITLGVNEKFDLNVGYITNEADYNAAFSCKSSNSKYVTVSANGVVTAKRAGSAAITVTSADGVSAVCVVKVKRAPSSVKISPTKGNMAVGQSGAFKWTLSKGSAGSVRFESGDPAVLEVANDGSVIAKSAGTVKVRVRTYNGKTATSTITVHPEPESVTFTRSGDPMRFAVGMKGTLRAVLAPSNYGTRSFESSNPNIISIDAKTGAYKVLGMGECDLTVTAYNGVRETRHAKVYVAPTQVKAVDTRLTLGVGEKYSMRIRASAPNDQECEPGLIYKSSSARVASVDENGVITAKKSGSATITATSFNGFKVTCKVTVRKKPTSLSLNAAELTLGQNESYQLKAKLSPSGCGAVVRYETSDPSLATVDEKGRIVARGDAGVVTVTARTYNGLAKSCAVTLGREPVSVEFPVDSVVLYVGMKYKADAQINGGVCNSLSAASSNASVAYLDGSGRIVAKKKGKAEIRVQTYNGCSDSIYVTVASAPSKCYLDLPGTLHVGELYKLTDYFRTSPQSNPGMTFGSAKVSGDCAVIFEDETGVYLKPVKAGSFTVTAKSYNGKSVRKSLKAVEPDQNVGS